MSKNMVSKTKQKKSPETSINEDIYLDDLQVEIKQEEELIIEDADQEHVQWCFIGLDDDINTAEFAIDGEGDGEGNESSAINSNHCNNSSIEGVIEISDDENDSYGEVGPALLDSTCEVMITNEPLHDSLVAISGIEVSCDSGKELNALHDNLVTTSCIEAGGESEKVFNNLHDCSQNDKAAKAKEIPIDKDIKEEKDIKDLRDKTDILTVSLINENMSRKLMKIRCHLCATEFQHKIYKWIIHLKKVHPKEFNEITSKYKDHSDNAAVCKICNFQVTPKVNHTLHYITRHFEHKPNIFLCAHCDYNTNALMELQKHQMDQHNEFLSRRYSCPKCGIMCNDLNALELHFMTAHVRESNSKYLYKCHLCDDFNLETSKTKFFGHLIEKHKLTSWKTLNFRKLDNGTFYSCSKCNKTFIKSNTNTLLLHYLTHEDKSSWYCKYCRNLSRFRDWPTPHLCQAMRTYLESKNKAGSDQCEEQRTISWQEFELNIIHICPFCNEEFHKFEDWRLHVRELHHIQTLEGLNMTILPDDNDKLLCLQCKEHVRKSPVELHKHRFKHLPYEPYKCRHCDKLFPTYYKALHHVKNQCQDVDETDIKPLFLANRPSFSSSKTATAEETTPQVIIQCPLCNNKKFANFLQISKHITNVHDSFDKQFSKLSKNDSRTCKICQSEIKTKERSKLIAHFLQHLSERPFKCQKCSRSYPSHWIALRHVQSCHIIGGNFHNTSIKEEEEGDDEIKSKSEIEKIIVDNSGVKNNCQVSDKETSALTLPIANVLSNPTPPPTPPLPNNGNTSEPIQEYQNDTVDISGNSIGLVDPNHPVFKTYEPFISFLCPECSKAFTSCIMWEEHIISQHTFYTRNGLRFDNIVNGRAKCLDCHTFVIQSKSKLMNHKLIHMPSRSFVCRLCSQHFTALTALYKHLRNTHLTNGAFKCPLCPQVLQTDFERIEHVKKSHPSKKRPNNMCSICFKIPNSLENHLQTNHLTHQRTHRCNECGVYFEYTQELENHRNKIHSAKTVNKSYNHIDIAGTDRSSITKSPLGKRKARSLSSDRNTKSTHAKKKLVDAISHKKGGRKL